MKKDILITRLCDLLNIVEQDNRKNFDDGEIEDLVVEARIPVTPSNGRVDRKS